MSDRPAADDGLGSPTSSAGAILPQYEGACLCAVVPTLLSMLPDRARGAGDAVVPSAAPTIRPPWVPEAIEGARQIVLLALDGLGWEQLRAMHALAPVLARAEGGPITSVAPTTTATALTSLTTGTPPAVHGVVGYRVAVDDPGAGAPHGRDVMNVLRWRTSRGDARRLVPPATFQTVAPFGGRAVPAVTRSEFAATGFTAAHLSGARLVGWSVPSSLVVGVRKLLAAGEPFLYVYYDGLDKVAHEHGLGDYFEQELVSVDRLVGDLVDALPPGAALVITSDHGQVEVGGEVRMLAPALFDDVELLSGEGRFRWLHCRSGARDDVVATARELHGSEAWVWTRDEMVGAGWFGGPLSEAVARRLGDVALVAHAPVAFLDPADTGETRLMARHGSLTAAEMWVPLLVFGAP
jgi:hypothetical protein